LTNAELPRRGQRFLEEIEAALGSERSPESTAVYAAQATGILLDAIARSGGTRSSVTRELRQTSVEEGIVGNIRFRSERRPRGKAGDHLPRRRRATAELVDPTRIRGAVVYRTIIARAAVLR
jgi:hypothetical protein